MSGLKGAQPPTAWVVSRVCEEFGCLPDAACRLLDDEAYSRLAFTIMDLRAYAATYRRFRTGSKHDTMEDVPARTLDEIHQNDLTITMEQAGVRTTTDNE